MNGRYYADSNTFTWLRNKVFKLEKPTALPWGGWAVWERETRAARPFAYFICETLPDILEKPAEWIVDPLNDAAYYLRNRFINKTHYLHTDLEPGKWHEFESRMLHGCFTELVDFVEIEKAWSNVSWNEQSRKEFQVPWWRSTQLFRWKRWRCPEAGIAHLKWEMTLDSESLHVYERCDHQAVAAREIMLLYTWWTVTRRARKDEWEETGLRVFWNQMDQKYDDDWLGLGKPSKMTPAERTTYTQLTEAVDALEKARKQEDEDMLIRLVKLRTQMWT